LRIRDERWREKWGPGSKKASHFFVVVVSLDISGYL